MDSKPLPKISLMLCPRCKKEMIVQADYTSCCPKCRGVLPIPHPNKLAHWEEGRYGVVISIEKI